MHRCDGCRRQFEEDELTELEYFQDIPLQNLCSRCLGMIFVKSVTQGTSKIGRLPSMVEEGT